MGGYQLRLFVERDEKRHEDVGEEEGVEAVVEHFPVRITFVDETELEWEHNGDVELGVRYGLQER